MSCLLCLRNEGIHLSNESSHDFQILLQLFSLPEEFSQYLEGNKYCSLCRVKLNFVQVLNEEISILSKKLKCFEKEVKGIFVSSFEGNQFEKPEEIANEARKKLFNKLNNYNFDFPEASMEIPVVKIEIDQSQIFENEEVGFVNEDPLSNPEFKAADSDAMIEDTDTEIRVMCKSEENVEYSIVSSTPSLNSAKTRRSNRQKKVEETKQTILQRPRVNLRNYTKARIYTCRLCRTKPTFSQNDKYEKHVKNAHPFRHYSTCPICSRIILEEENFSKNQIRTKLRVHMKIHTGLRQFNCDLCDMTFMRNGDLKTHKETHLKREMFNCDICEKKVRGKRNLNQHMRRVHGKWD